jgi:hypothetical protein
VLCANKTGTVRICLYIRLPLRQHSQGAVSAVSSVLWMGGWGACSHAGFRFCAGEGGADEATQYGPVAPDVTVTILEAAHTSPSYSVVLLDTSLLEHAY